MLSLARLKTTSSLLKASHASTHDLLCSEDSRAAFIAPGFPQRSQVLSPGCLPALRRVSCAGRGPTLLAQQPPLALEAEMMLEGSAGDSALVREPGI